MRGENAVAVAADVANPLGVFGGEGNLRNRVAREEAVVAHVGAEIVGGETCEGFKEGKLVFLSLFKRRGTVRAACRRRDIHVFVFKDRGLHERREIAAEAVDLRREFSVGGELFLKRVGLAVARERGKERMIEQLAENGKRR